MIDNIERYFAQYVRKEMIDGVETYVIVPEKMEDFRESGILEKLGRAGNHIELLMKNIIDKNVDVALYMGLVYMKEFKNPIWFPVLCWKAGERYYHVHFRESWMCRDCGYKTGRMLYPVVEGDRIIYHKRWPKIGEVFKKVPCPKCGHLLQGHIVMLDGK